MPHENDKDNISTHLLDVGKLLLPLKKNMMLLNQNDKYILT
jgi:hypothetical protein